jgi:hypothetical protein
MGDEEEEDKGYKLFVPGLPGNGIRPEKSTMFSGYGVATYAPINDETAPDTYAGVFIEGYRRGKGVYTFGINGDKYEGYYEENKKHGFGKMSYTLKKVGEDGAVIEPEDGKPIMREGTYLGYFSAGMRGKKNAEDTSESEGTFTYANGDIYVGQWLQGKKHGKGTYSYAKDGTKLIGDFVEGKIVRGEWIFPNGTFYSGKFRYNKPHGKGVWVFKNGNQLTGEYIQKEQQTEEEPPEDPEAPRPDPEVWCHFKHGRNVVVQGGSMVVPKD